MSLLSFQQTLITAEVDGPALAAAAAASMLPAASKYTLPPNFFRVGKQLQINAMGRISTVITTPGTARFDLRLGNTVVWDSLAIVLDTAAAHVNVPWELELLITCRTIGAAAALFGQGKFTSEVVIGFGAAPRGVVSAMLPWNTAPAVGATFDSTVSQVVDMFFTQTVATGGLTLHQYGIRELN
jgi:hypothetical protein